MRYPFLLALLYSSLSASTPPDSLNHLSWRLIGPFRGGRSVAVSGVPNDGATFYFGAVDGGVWKTTDAGTTWAPIFDGQPVASIGAIAVAPSDPNIIYAGTGETDIRSNLASGDGVYKSTDAGRTWHKAGLKETRQISRIVVSPEDPNYVLVGALGHAYGPNDDRGVFLSSDGGESFKKVLDRGPNVGVADLAIASDKPTEVFATLWEAHRPAWSTYAPLTGPGSGLFRSQNGGKTWKEVTGHGLPESTWGRAGVAISPGTKGKRVYAVIEAKDGGLYRSDDGGDRWSLVNNDPRLTSRGWYFNSITADPNDPDTTYIPNVALYKLADGGKTLSIVRGAPGGDDYHQLWVDPANSLRMALATDQGTSISLNGGRTWSTWYNQPTGQFYHVIADNDFPYHVYGAQQDSGTGALATRSDRGQIDARDLFNVGGSESGYIALDAKDPNIFYVTGTFGTVDRYDRRTMQSQNIAPLPAPGGLSEVYKRKLRDPWTPVIVSSGKAPFPVFLGTQYVMKTVDGGLHWQTISPDLTGAVPGLHSDSEGAPPTLEKARDLGYGVVYTIAPSPLDLQEIWAGSDTGLVHVTRDGGKKWSNVTPPGLSAFSKITQIEASHFKAGEAYVAVDRHRLDDRKPYLFRTTDFGKTWTPITDGISDPAFLNCVREDPMHQGLLFAGTEFGVYVSTDDGGHWISLQRNLPVTSIRDIAVHGNDLVVATHGRAFWVMDDFAALRDLKADAVISAVHLFAPSPAIRMKSDSFLGTPLPPEEPQAANPPAGAAIDYYLPDAASDVALDILDVRGKVIRHYSSREHATAPSTAVPIAPRWFEKPRMLGTSAGSHRFMWDLRYGRSGLPDSGDDEDEDQRWVGPLVIPGKYQARLTVDGKTLSAPLQVTMDPRAHVPSAVLAEQFDWALKSFTDMITARKAVAEMQGLRAKLNDLKSNPEATSLRQKTEELLNDSKSGKAGMVGVSRSLTTALNAIENADRTPPSQVIELYQTASKNLRPAMQAWQQVKTGELPRLNQTLKSHGLVEIQVSELEQRAEESLAR